MQFIQQGQKGVGNFGTILFTIASLCMGFIAGNLVAEKLSLEFLGHSLVHLPETADPNAILALNLLPFGFAMATLLLCVKNFHRRPMMSVLTSRKRFDLKRFFFAFFVWGAVMTVTLIVGGLMGAPMTFQFNASSFFPLLAISLFIVPIQTTTEELVFRGYLFQQFGNSFRFGLASIVISGVLFGLLHAGNPEIAKLGYGVLSYYIGTGIFLGIVTHMDDGIELAAGYHTVNNVFGILIVTNNWQVFTTDALFVDHSEPTYIWETVLTLGLLQPLMLFLFSKVYKWKNWKSKMFQRVETMQED